jgi:long-chain acyl-CoA synthetase
LLIIKVIIDYLYRTGDSMVKKTVPNLDEVVFSVVERVVEKSPDKPAIIYLGENFSYARLKDLIYRFGTALYALGVRDNDKVMLYIPNCPQFLIGYFGAQIIGAVPVPVSPIYTPAEIGYLINDSGAETVLCQDTNFGYVQRVLPKTCLKRVIVTNLVDLLPWWKRAIGKTFDKIPDGVVVRTENVYFFRELISKYPPQPPEVRINPREHLAYLLYTGGTTGFPKGVPGTHSTMVAAVNDHRAVTEGYVSNGDDTLVLVNPLFHILAEQSILALGLSRGNPTVLMPMPQVDAILEAIQRYKATLFLGVPTLYRMILENDRLELYDLSSLKYCFSGGDVLPLEVYNRWKAMFGIPLRQDYGCTEQALITLCPLDRISPPGAIGFPVASKQIKIVDSDTLEPVPPNTPGELLVTSEYTVKSYWNKPEETANSYVELEGKIWYRTRDYVRMDEDGLLYYVDRSADVIKYKGYRVSASEIEAVLQDHEAVIGACAVGVPDPGVGERIKAMVVLKEDARGVGGAELMRWCRERLAPYKVPQYIEFRDMLPKSKVGKLLRREIREEERRRMAKEGEKEAPGVK